MKNEIKNEEQYYEVKFIIVGDISVGKTNICLRFTKDDFNESLNSTVVVGFQIQTIKIEDKIFLLQLWDTAGSEAYKSITKGFYSNSACCILIYDMTEKKSFESINEWIQNVQNYTNENIIFILVGNKSDLKEGRKVTVEQGQALADEFNMKFIEASAKTGYNVDLIFNIACQKIYENIKENIYNFEDEYQYYGIKKIYNKNKLIFNKTFKLLNENEINESMTSSKKSKRRKIC